MIPQPNSSSHIPKNPTSHLSYSGISPSNQSHTSKIGFLASHNGSSMQAIVQEILAGTIHAIPQIIVSNNHDSVALNFAQEHNITSAHISRKTEGDDAAVDTALCSLFSTCDWIVLSGYMRPIGPKMLEKFSHKMFNIHPSLLPAFSGQGMFGRKIHAAVIKAKAAQTGITIHQVESGYDTGQIMAQMTIPVSANETVDSLEEKVKNCEPAFFAEFIRQLCADTAC